jgi:hypothetical protein
MRSCLLAAIWIAACIPSAFGQQFQNIFKERSHDFGNVTRAAKTEHRFYFENPFSTPLHVRSVRTSCGCTTPSILTETVQPGEVGCILAVFNTGTHSGSRGATITVTFDKPSFAEVQLNVKGYIRWDVVFTPGQVAFGKVPEGSAKELDVHMEYVGKSTWNVTHVSCDLPYVKVGIRESLRQGGKVHYDLKVSLDQSAPAGPIQSEITLHTNDLNIKTLSLGFSADIESTLSIQPNLVSLGAIGKEEQVKKLIRLTGAQPFKIISIESEAFDVSATKLDEKSKDVHLVPLVFSPKSLGSDKSEQKGKIYLLTDMDARPRLELDVVYRIKEDAVPLSASIK